MVEDSRERGAFRGVMVGRTGQSGVIESADKKNGGGMFLRNVLILREIWRMFKRSRRL
jgi:hypothetical protein